MTKLTDRGTNAMQNILSTVVFSIGPQLFDVLAAATYLAQVGGAGHERDMGGTWAGHERDMGMTGAGHGRS